MATPRVFLAVALVTLLAAAFVPDVAAQGTWCRVSAYKVDPATVQSYKSKLWAACASKAKITQVGGVTVTNGCAKIKQQVESEAAWNAYSACEKSAGNAAYYNKLKAGSDACKAYQSSGAGACS